MKKALLSSFLLVGMTDASDWKQELDQELTVLGHRNRVVVADADIQTLPHSEFIQQLDEAGETFRIVLFKTDLALPSTSVFIRLDCGYWSAEAEAALRIAIEEGE